MNETTYFARREKRAPGNWQAESRQAARVMAAYAHLSGDRTNAWAIVIVRLAALAEAVAELRDAQSLAEALDAARRLAATVSIDGRAAAEQAMRAHMATACPGQRATSGRDGRGRGDGIAACEDR